MHHPINTTGSRTAPDLIEEAQAKRIGKERPEVVGGAQAANAKLKTHTGGLKAECNKRGENGGEKD
jgi:hypothetical protein